MPRIRTIKPELSKHEGVFDLEAETGLPIRFAWAMLPCFCDREGRFEWRTRRLTAEILPYDEEADMARVLDALTTRGFVAKYRVGDAWFGWIPTFTKHQVVNNRESASDIPPIEDADEVIYSGNHALPDACPTREPRDDDARATPVKRKGRERKGKEGRESDAPRKRGCRIPENFPTDDDLTWASENHPAVNRKLEAEKFRDYWSGVSGQKGVKLDWPATWRNWIRRTAENQPKTAEQPDGPLGEVLE
jgi:hypothetical protein